MNHPTATHETKERAAQLILDAETYFDKERTEGFEASSQSLELLVDAMVGI